uniref:Cathepsin propeptide inhibitor domain-containing protein n=1 Tax=Kalanchoe fedtschenkoi TaxID=63787 RepID=A0A7N0VME2_KALFE
MASAHQWQLAAALLLLVILMASSLQSSLARTLSVDSSSMRARHEEWIAEHGKAYKDPAEKEARFRIFNANADYIDSFNSLHAAASSYTLSINQFADLTNDEFKASRNGYKHITSRSSAAARTPFKYENVTQVPSTVDWRKKGAVTPVKDQGQCALLLNVLHSLLRSWN